MNLGITVSISHDYSYYSSGSFFIGLMVFGKMIGLNSFWNAVFQRKTGLNKCWCSVKWFVKKYILRSKWRSKTFIGKQKGSAIYIHFFLWNDDENLTYQQKLGDYFRKHRNKRGNLRNITRLSNSFHRKVTVR